MCMGEFCLHKCLHPQRSEEGTRSPGTGVIGGWLWMAMWVLGIELESSGRAARALNH